MKYVGAKDLVYFEHYGTIWFYLLNFKCPYQAINNRAIHVCSMCVCSGCM